jgi:hypothetical protein
MASWIVSVLVDKHSPGGEWSRQNRLPVDKHSLGGEWSRKNKLLVDRYSPCGEWSRIDRCWWKDILLEENDPGWQC